MTSKTGVLYLCATPIGNLEDMTFRAVRILKEADLIAAEDTRNSIRLLKHFDIHTPMTSYHEYNRIEKGQALVKKLLEGQDIVLITDAGMPGISDPGEDLVRMCHEAGITATAVPGACACVTALAVSGQHTRRFCFEAFLPSDKKERGEILTELAEETRTILLYEAPHRLKKTLAELLEKLGDRRLSICRELTKRYETIWETTLAEACVRYGSQEPRGEYVLVLEGRQRADLIRERQQDFQRLSYQEHMKLYKEQGMDRKAAMKRVAKDRGVSKREVYQALLLEK